MRRYSTVASVLWFMLFAAAVSAAEEEIGAPAAGPPPTAAPLQLPQWISIDLLKAQVAINMTDAQKTPFNKVVGNYIEDHYAMIVKETKKNAPNLEMTLKSRDKALFHTMDDQVREILTQEQWSAYETYRELLRAALPPGAMRCTGSGADQRCRDASAGSFSPRSGPGSGRASTM